VPVRLYTKDITLLKRSGKIWKGAGAKSYLPTGFLKHDLMFAHFLIYKEAFPHI
jgi:hypothetical protein